MAKGIEIRHTRLCRVSRGGKQCDCEPTYRPYVWDAAARRQVRGKKTGSYAEAAAWRRDALVAVRRRRPISVGGRLFRDVSAEWLDAARSGGVRTRSRERYKPSAIRSYERALRLRVLPVLGDEPIEDIRRADLQELVERLAATRMAENTIEATVIPVRAIFRREIEHGRLAVNPTIGLSVPHSRARRDRIATPAEAAALVAAVPEGDRAVWATAMYAGLRRGELRALQVERIDLELNVVHVERGWDDQEGEIETKGRRRRRVPIPRALGRELRAHLLRTGRRSGLVFGETPEAPFRPKGLTERADQAWKDTELDRITLHECRHAYASLMIAAGVNAKALCDYMGHSSITVTYDRYGHLMPGNEEEAAGLLDGYLERAIGAQTG